MPDLEHIGNSNEVAKSTLFLDHSLGHTRPRAFQHSGAPALQKHFILFFGARKVAERKFPEFLAFLSRILLRIFPEFFEEFSETRKYSPKIPTIFQCKILRQVRRKNIQNHNFCDCDFKQGDAAI